MSEDDAKKRTLWSKEERIDARITDDAYQELLAAFGVVKAGSPEFIAMKNRCQKRCDELAQKIYAEFNLPLGTDINQALEDKKIVESTTVCDYFFEIAWLAELTESENEE